MNSVVGWEEIDLSVPVAAFFSAVAERPYSFFLDSGMVSAKLGRYSFLGWDPFLVLWSKDGHIEMRQEGQVLRSQGDPWEALQELLNEYTLPAGMGTHPSSQGVPPLLGGAVGYLAYDLGRFIEQLPRTTVDDLRLPDYVLGFYDVVLIVDHLQEKTYLASCGFPAQGPARLKRAAIRLREVREQIQQFLGQFDPPSPRRSPASSSTNADPTGVEISSNFTKPDYLRAIERAKEYIAAGDIYQVNLSQRLCAELRVPPYQLYYRLRTINPAPFAAYLNLGEDGIIASASPERFLRYFAATRRMQTRPIKGTRPRGRTPREDAALARELRASEKDRAEHLMIVDLERNDLGRVAEIGSVRVSEFEILETYPTVFHLTSTVEGTLAPQYDRVALLRAMFPGGSITGAPKIRSMEIIDELEPTQRGVYTGSIGYLSFTGEVDLSIVIRTFILKDGQAYFQVGGGIVADSDPEAEYEETLDKAQALIAAVSSAE